MTSSTSKQLSLRWINAAGLGGCLLISLIGYATLAGPFLQQRSAAAGQSRERETRQRKIDEIESALGAAKDRLAVVQQQLAASAVQLESAAHVNRRIAAVTEFFSHCHLYVDDVQTGSVSSGLQYDLVPITIVGRGAYQQCAELLHGLCAKYPDMSVMSVELTGNPKEPAESAKFRLELFWYAAPSGPARKPV